MDKPKITVWGSHVLTIEISAQLSYEDWILSYQLFPLLKKVRLPWWPRCDNVDVGSTDVPRF